MRPSGLRRARLAFVLFAAVLFCRAAFAVDGATGNLLVNGDAETHRCTDDWTAQTPVPGWRVLRGAASVLCYSAFDSAGETPVVPRGGTAGRALFGAPGADTAMEQLVDVRAASDAIDRGRVGFTLAAWLGGWRDRPESATLTAIFLDDAGQATGAPVVLGDAGATARAGRSGFVQRQIKGTVPRKTRRIAVTVHFLSGMTSYHNAYADNIRLTLDGEGELAGLAPAGPAPPPAAVPPLDHVYLVMMENTNYADVIHASGGLAQVDRRMPFLASLARKGVILTDLWGTYHPSDQNYVAMVAGDTFRYGPVYYPDFDLAVPHLGDLLEAHGRRWRAYVQNMRTPCNLVADSTQGFYAPDDQPFVQFQDVVGDAARCMEAVRDLADFEAAVRSGALPDFAWIAADGWWDGEGAWYDNFDVGVSLASQDRFLKAALKTLLGSARWKNSRSLLIVTWDESQAWGWPDNRVATVLVGSPGLLKEGSIVTQHFDGYGILRTIEEAFDLGSLDRFDRYAMPLNAAFNQAADAGVTSPGDLRPDESVSTRGSIQDTFGRGATPAAVVQGDPLKFMGPDDVAGNASVSLTPFGQIPTQGAMRYGIDPSTRSVTIPTAHLAPGVYGAWLLRGAALPDRAPLAVTILPPARVRQDAPGVEIVGAGSSKDAEDAVIEVREGSNLVVRYCRPEGALAADTWIGVFESGTPADQMTKDNANAIGFWLRTPGGPHGQPCGEAIAFASELTPGTDYQVLLLRDASDGTSAAVGRSAAFALTPALP